MEENDTSHKKPGPIPGPPTKKYTVLLEEDLGEWGKRQPGGLSELMRALLRKAQSNSTQREALSSSSD